MGFFFSRKEAKALVQLRRSRYATTYIGESELLKTYLLNGFLLVQNEAKALYITIYVTHNSAKPTQGVWGRAPRENTRRMQEMKELENDLYSFNSFQYPVNKRPAEGYNCMFLVAL
jgi:hypothetical protein